MGWVDMNQNIKQTKKCWCVLMLVCEIFFLIYFGPELVNDIQCGGY